MNTKFSEALNNSSRIAIFSHAEPDADALCSAFALKNIIYNNYDYKFVDVFVDGEIGELYSPIIRNEILNPRPYSNYDVAFVVECPNVERIGEKGLDVIKDIPFVINIDHHETKVKFGDLNIVSPKVSSTCELIYILSQVQNLELNNLIAKQLYQGIITDTGCFTSLTTTSRTYRVVSELMKYKFDPNAIKEYYFKNNSMAKTKLLSMALSSMKFYKGELFTTMKIPYNAFEKSGASFEDTMGIVDNGININGTAITAMIIEKKPGFLYCSLRSKGLVNVGDIAKEFGGGGSETVGAFQIEGNIDSLEKKLVEIVLPKLQNVEQVDEIFF